MDTQQKRAALFEYFKKINNPKWVNNGDKLFKVLHNLQDDRVDAMYSRMLELKRRNDLLQRAKEMPMYKRWKMPLTMFILWGVFALIDANSTSPHIASIMLQSFIAGSYFEELMSNLIYNYIENKYRSPSEKV